MLARPALSSSLFSGHHPTLPSPLSPPVSLLSSLSPQANASLANASAALDPPLDSREGGTSSPRGLIFFGLALLYLLALLSALVHDVDEADALAPTDAARLASGAELARELAALQSSDGPRGRVQRAAWRR